MSNPVSVVFVLLPTYTNQTDGKGACACGPPSRPMLSSFNPAKKKI